jgi:hypothetical protein
MKCCICGTVKNCEPYLDKIFRNMEQIASLFEDYSIMLYYDKSRDNTLNKLIQYKLKNSHFNFYVNKDPLFNYRTHNIAKGRNYCINYINETHRDYDYFIMMDCDDVCENNVNLNVLQKNLLRDDWDCLSFNKEDYYDIWALSYGPYACSFYIFNCGGPYNLIDNNQGKIAHDTMKNNIKNTLKRCPSGEFVKCYSAFNGFAIYKSDKFLNCKYDGRLDLSYIPKQLLSMNIKHLGNLSTLKYVYNEDCEHRRFHFEAFLKNNARIRISPEIIF